MLHPTADRWFAARVEVHGDFSVVHRGHAHPPDVLNVKPRVVEPTHEALAVEALPGR
jgi:hypothetical protein